MTSFGLNVAKQGVSAAGSAYVSKKNTDLAERRRRKFCAAVAVASGNLPIKNGDFPCFFLCLPEGIVSGNDCYITIGK